MIVEQKTFSEAAFLLHISQSSFIETGHEAGAGAGYGFI